MQKLLKIALLPCLAALTFAAAPVAQAVSVSSSAPTATTLTSGTTSTTTLSKQQVKQQKKLRKKCAKLSSGKLKASKRAKLMAMCKTTAANTDEASKPTPPATSNAAENASNSNAGGNSANSNAGGNSSNSNAGGNSANSNAGGNSANSNAGDSGTGGTDQVVELIQSSPAIFVPLVASTEKTDGETSDEAPSFLAAPAPSAVPEPGSLALLGLGLIGLGFARRRAAR